MSGECYLLCLEVGIPAVRVELAVLSWCQWHLNGVCITPHFNWLGSNWLFVWEKCEIQLR